MSAALELDVVRSVSLKIHKPPLNNIFNLSIYVDDGSGTASEETIAAVELAIKGDGTALHQGHLVPGVEIRVLPPQTFPVDISVIVEVYRANIQEAENEVKRIIAEYINSLTIKKKVILSEISARIMKLPYVNDVKIISPEENIIIGEDQIARYRNADVEVRESYDG